MKYIIKVVLSVKEVSKPKTRTLLKMKFKVQTKLVKPLAITLAALRIFHEIKACPKNE